MISSMHYQATILLDKLYLKLKKKKKNVGIKLVKTKIMNQLSYHVDDSKIRKYGLKLNSDLQKDVDDTLKLFNYLKY